KDKTTGTLQQGDLLKVTSADGKAVVLYELEVTIVSAGNIEAVQINVYPNPTSGEIKIKGVEPGNQIQIYNMSGSVVRDIKAQNNLTSVYINDQPSGVYLIVIRNDNKVLGQYKAIKR